MLLTHANWKHAGEYSIIKRNILQYLKHGVVPIINENDVVAEEEIRSRKMGIGENDRLARMVAEMIKADGVLLLTEVGGVYDRDPSDKDAKRLRIVGDDFAEKIKVVENKSKKLNGMKEKLRSAFECRDLGMRVSIAGLERDVITRFALGKHVGTSVGKKSVL
jgi:glutamate 5-kinase